MSRVFQLGSCELTSGSDCPVNTNCWYQWILQVWVYHLVVSVGTKIIIVLLTLSDNIWRLEVLVLLKLNTTTTTTNNNNTK